MEEDYETDNRKNRRHPQYFIDTANRIFEEQRKDLYNIFKKYAQF